MLENTFAALFFCGHYFSLELRVFSDSALAFGREFVAGVVRITVYRQHRQSKKLERGDRCLIRLADVIRDERLSFDSTPTEPQWKIDDGMGHAQRICGSDFQ
jgi:hypothetical protein